MLSHINRYRQASVLVAHVKVDAEKLEDSSQSRESSQTTVQQAVTWVCRHKTLAILLSFQATAFVAAVSHLIFFQYLNGTQTERQFIRQPHVTTISVLLTTIFKASVAGAVGLSFAQHMWRVFRQNNLSVHRIEQLFSLRSNPVELFRIRTTLVAPILFAMALFIWLLPLVAIYPPSALTVSFQAYLNTQDLNVSVMNPLQSDLEPIHPERTLDSTLSIMYSNPGSSLDISNHVKTYFWSLRYSQPKRTLLQLAKSNLVTGIIPDFATPEGENATYRLNFKGPQLSCTEDLASFEEKRFIEKDSKFSSFDVAWPSIVDQALNPSLIITTLYDLNWYPYNPAPNETAYVFGKRKVLTCQPVSVDYNVEVSYAKAIRRITSTTQGQQSLGVSPPIYFNYTGLGSGISSVEELFPHLVTSQDYQKWVAEAKIAERQWNIWALLDASMLGIVYNCSQTFIGSSEHNLIELANGTWIDGGWWDKITCDNAGVQLLESSVFNPGRYNDADNANTRKNLNDAIDPRTYSLTESMLNQYLTNVTISALSLNTWKASTAVNATEYRTTYYFSDPLNLVIPYSVSLLLCVFFVSIGVWSIVQNGTSAVDGGFLQVMTSTTGRTKMEDIVRTHHIDGDNLPQELLDLEIRYGELVDGEGIGTGVAGFGTIEETKTLEKRSGVSYFASRG